jgi:Helix-turn-helix domain
MIQDGQLELIDYIKTGKPSQEDMILEYLRKGNSITPLEALNMFGCFRLGARIWDLKSKGHNIIEETVHDNGKHYGRYRLCPTNSII